MEEILASIRRIIADDEAKPAVKPEAVAPAPAPAPKPVMKDIPPSVIAPPPKPVSVPPKPAAPPAPAPAAAAPVSNSQDDIDAMLASLDAATPPAEIRPAPPPEPEPDVFELTDEMALAAPEPPKPPPAPPHSSFSRIEPDDDIEFSESKSRHAPEPQPEPQPLNPMLSRSTVSAVESAFNSLANTVLSNNARTLEDLVKEMLRPMLKSWLDDNLPGLVERIVKAEIERVSRGR